MKDMKVLLYQKLEEFVDLMSFREIKHNTKLVRAIEDIESALKVEVVR